MTDESLRSIFHRQKGVYKWDHYFDIYERFFSRFREENVTLFEIGVYKGGSVRMWRDYFPNAQIVGIDISEECRAHEGDRISIEIGDQADMEFLASVCEKHGPPAIVIDDGSHNGSDQIASIEALFPRLSRCGVYLVEDLHAPESASFSEYARGEIGKLATNGPGVSGVHFFRSMVVFEKDDRLKSLEVSR